MAAIGEENEQTEHVPKPNKNRGSQTNKRDTLMEKVDQGNKAICEAIKNLTMHIASLQQIPQSQQRRISEEPNKNTEHSLRLQIADSVRNVNSPTLMESVTTVTSEAVQNTGHQNAE